MILAKASFEICLNIEKTFSAPMDIEWRLKMKISTLFK